MSVNSPSLPVERLEYPRQKKAKYKGKAFSNTVMEVGYIRNLGNSVAESTNDTYLPACLVTSPTNMPPTELDITGINEPRKDFPSISMGAG